VTVASAWPLRLRRRPAGLDLLLGEDLLLGLDLLLGDLLGLDRLLERVRERDVRDVDVVDDDVVLGEVGRELLLRERIGSRRAWPGCR
jgi:hypothetical protein